MPVISENDLCYLECLLLKIISILVFKRNSPADF